MAFDIDIKVKVDSTKATEELNKLSAQLAKIYGTPAEMLAMQKALQSDQDRARNNSSVSSFHMSNKELAVALASALGLVFVPGAPIVATIASAIAQAGIGYLIQEGLEKLNQSANLGQIDLSNLHPLNIQGFHDTVESALQNTNRKIDELTSIYESTSKERLGAEEHVPIRQYSSGTDHETQIRELQKYADDLKQLLDGIQTTYEQQVNAPFEALSGQIKIFAESFAAYKTESLDYLMSTAETVQELARLMNKRDADGGHDVRHIGGIIGEGGGGRLGSLYGIPRYHSGGLIGAREQLAVLQRGEGVFTPGQMQNADHLIAILTGSLGRIEQELIQNLNRNPSDGFSLDLLSNAITEGLILGLANGFMPGFLGQQAVASTNPQSPTQTQSNAEPGQQILQFGNEAQDMLQQVEGYTEDALLGMENALIQFVQTGKFEFKDLTNSILNDLLQISTREAITKPLSNALGNVFSGLFGGGGGGGDPRSEHLFSSLAPRPPYHKGGIVGDSNVFRLKTMRDVLNEYHSGGVIGGNEEVAILQRGEGVFTPEQMQNANQLFDRAMNLQQPAPVNLTVLIKNGDGPARKGKGEFRADGRGGGTTTINMAEQLEGYLATRVARGYGPLAKVLRDQQRGRRWFRTVVVEGVKALQGGFTHGLAKLSAVFAKKLVS